MNVKTKLYQISRPIKTDGTKYEYIASHYNLPNYRIISSGEMAIRGKDLDIPYYVREFSRQHNEVIMMCNIINKEISGIIFRALDEKVFTNYGLGKGNFYGIGQLDDNFKYGDLIVLVEGAIDRDVCSLFITKNCLSVLTSTITNNQLQVLENLTNKVLLLLDNDEAGNNGEVQTKRKLNQVGITCYTINKSEIIKDLGDLLELKRKNDMRADLIIQNYRAQIQIHGGKLV